MKKIFIITAVIVSIPFFVVIYFNQEKDIREIKLNYLSNVIVKVKRSNGNIDYIPLEKYVVGVIAGEMPVNFHEEALKAQAVASRSYVLNRIRDNSEYDVVDTVSNQVYYDDNQLRERWGDNYTKYISKVREAVNGTSMEYLEYNGKVIDAMFFSTSNGYTEDVMTIFNEDLPYLKSVESIYDKEVSPVFYGNVSMSLQEFYERIGLNYNKKLNVQILEKSKSNRVVRLIINGVKLSGRDLYDKLGLKSYDFSIEQVGDNVNIKTCGYGHGVGLSQYGAEGMAIKGYSYRDILSHYYVGTNLKKIKN